MFDIGGAASMCTTSFTCLQHGKCIPGTDLLTELCHRPRLADQTGYTTKSQFADTGPNTDLQNLRRLCR